MPVSKVPAVFDHLMFGGGQTLSALVAQIAERTGVTAIAGGRHVTGGTHNALLSLGGMRYLELMAADPEGDSRATRARLVRGLLRPRIIAWAIATRDLEATCDRARAAGYDPGPIEPLARQRPDGQRLAWRLAWQGAGVFSGIVPFLIDWQDCPHPATTAPAGCSLLSLRAEHPEPARAGRMLEALGVSLAVTAGREPALEATLATPRGRLVLR